MQIAPEIALIMTSAALQEGGSAASDAPKSTPRRSTPAKQAEPIEETNAGDRKLIKPNKNSG